MPGTAVRRILLIDAVPWGRDHPPGHPLRDVATWFTPHLTAPGGVEIRCVTPDGGLEGEPASDVAGVVLSGSPRDAWGPDPVNEVLCGVIHRCRTRRIPFLGVCYGHQLLGRALGGRVGRDPAGWELGTVPLRLTPAGERSPLFRGIPAEFQALQSHADAVLELPPGCELLASGTHTEIQSFSCESLLFGVQFHPETSPGILKFLWGPRVGAWRGRIGFDLDRRLESLEPAPVAAGVLSNFINHILP